VIPLYGFLRGDTLGLLILAEETDTVEALARKLEQSARLRVAHRPALSVVHKGRVLDGNATVRACKLEALDRFDVIERLPVVEVS
jgi:hypothetical protein